MGGVDGLRHDIVEMLDLNLPALQQRWVYVSPMSEARRQFAAVSVGNSIYVLGGHSQSSNVCILIGVAI